MAFNLGDILATVKVKSEGFSEAGKDVDNVGKKAGESGEQVQSFGEKLQSFATKVGVGMIAVGAGLTLFANNAKDTTVEFTKGAIQMSREIGVGVDEASRLVFAAQRMGLSVDDASKAFGILSKQIVATNNATEVGQTALSRLNIVTKNADGSTRDFTGVLFDVADKFKNMPNGVEKTTLAMELFGRSGKDLIPLLNQGAEGIKELEKKADELGITLTGDNIAKFQEYIKSQKDLADSSLALKMTIGREVIPAQAELNKKMNEGLQILLNLPEPFRGVAVAAAAFGGPVLSAAGSILVFAANVSEVLPMLKDMGKFSKITISVALIGAEVAFFLDMIIKKMNELQGEVDAMRKDSIPGLDKQLAQLDSRIANSKTDDERKKWEGLRHETEANKQNLTELADRYDGLGGKVNAFFDGYFQLLMTPVIKLADWLGLDDLSNMLQNLRFDEFLDMLGQLPGKIGEILGQIPGVVGQFFQNVYDSVSGWLSNIWNNVNAWFNNIISNISQWLSQLPGVVATWLSNTWNNFVAWGNNILGAVGSFFGSIPGRVSSFLSSLPGIVGTWLSNAYSTATSWASNILNAVGGFFGSIPGRVGQALSGLGGVIEGAFRSAWNHAKGALPGPVQSALSAIGLARGGIVPALQFFAGGGMADMFRSMGTDTVPAMLTPGEFVIKADTVKRLGLGTMQALNEGQLPVVGVDRGGNKKEVHEHHYHFDGVMARSEGDLRDIAEIMIRAYDQKRVMRNQAPLGAGV